VEVALVFVVAGSTSILSMEDEQQWTAN